MKNKVIILGLSIALIMCLFSKFWSLRNRSAFRQVASSEFRNLTLNGRVIDKTINIEHKEKTHTILLADSTRYILPSLDLDVNIEIGDFIYKKKWEYNITILKAGDPNNKIVFVLPYAD